MDAVDHVVLGAGAVGMAIAEALARRSESVRVVNRSGLREPMAGVQSVTGSLAGKEGSFVLRSVGTFDGKTAAGDVTVANSTRNVDVKYGGAQCWGGLRVSF